MTAAETKLQEAVRAGYEALALHKGSIDEAFAIFNRVATDTEVMDAANAELARSSSIHPQRCFVSGINARFLKQAIDQFRPVHQTPVPENTFAPQGHDDMTSKLKALAGLAKSTVAQVETDAEAALNDLQSAKKNADEGISKLKGVTADIKQSAADLNDFANQITNGGPPLA